MSVGMEQVVGAAFAGVRGGSVGVVDVAEVFAEEASLPTAPAPGGGPTRI